MTDEPAIKPRTPDQIFHVLSEDFRRRVVKRALKHRSGSKALRRQRGAALRRLRVDGYRDASRAPRPKLIQPVLEAIRDGLVPVLRADAEQPHGQSVGERVVRRFEAALEPLSRAGIAGLGATRGGGAGGAQTRPAPNPQQSLGLPGTPSPVRVNPAAPTARDSEAQDCCAQQLPSPRRVRTSWAPGCASAPLVDFAGVYGHDPRRQRCANHWQRTPARRTVRHVSARGISTGWSASPERTRSMTTRWATTSTASAAALWPPPTRSDSVKPTERALACHSARSASLERIFSQTARPALLARRFRFGVRGGTAPRQPLLGTREVWPRGVCWLV